MKDRLESIFLEERDGFVITFEVMLSCLLVSTISMANLYVDNVLQLQRFFSDVAASTCAMASRYGGNASKAYALQSMGGSIEESANSQLAYVNSRNGFVRMVPVHGGKFITVSDYPDANNNVHVNIAYRVGSLGVGGQMKDIEITKPIDISFTLPTLMQRGSLL